MAQAFLPVIFLLNNGTRQLRKRPGSAAVMFGSLDYGLISRS